jgi:hypothetical protein
MRNPPIIRVHAIVISLLALALLTGASAGVVGDRMLTPQPRRLRILTGDMSGVFDRLQLTAAQRVQAESIAARSAPRSQAIMLETAERLRAVADSADVELRAILTTEQRRMLDSLRGGVRFTLKRKVPGPNGTKVDTVFDSGIKPPITSLTPILVK